MVSSVVFYTQGLKSWHPTRCIRTMVFSDGQQYNGPFAPLDANQAVTFTFERYENQSGWTQTASINGITVSQVRPLITHIVQSSLNWLYLRSSITHRVP